MPTLYDASIHDLLAQAQVTILDLKASSRQLYKQMYEAHHTHEDSLCTDLNCTSESPKNCVFSTYYKYLCK